MYLGMATEEDKKMAKNWKDDADGILIFVRYLHFSKISHNSTGQRLDYSLLLLRR